jgi:hypothetical protein
MPNDSDQAFNIDARIAGVTAPQIVSAIEENEVQENKAQENISGITFLLGALYGLIAAGGIATILNRLREARGKMAARSRLTPSEIVQTSRQEMWEYVALLIGLVIFILLILIGPLYILLF